MSEAVFSSGAVLALVASIVALAAAISIARARSLLAIALMLALFAAALAAAFVALDAPDMGLVEALFGVGLLPLCWIGATVLTAPAVQTRVRTLRLGALVSAIAVGAALIWTALDLPAFGGATANLGRIYVTRAWGETGVGNGVAAVAGNYRAFDSLAQIGALMGAAFAAYALLGFGERAGRMRKSQNEGEEA